MIEDGRIGGVVAAALLPSLDPGSSKSSKLRVVLVDPVLHTSDEGVDQNYNDAVEEIKYPKSAEQYLAQNPKWTQEVARWKVIGVGKCDPEACAMLCNVSALFHAIFLIIEGYRS